MGGGWTLDFEFGTCISDLNLGLDLGLTIFPRDPLKKTWSQKTENDLILIMHFKRLFIGWWP